MDNKKHHNKIKMVNNKKYFNTPLDENGKPYWIPIVVKNKDFLLGFIEAYNVASASFGIPIEDMELLLSSDRLNDVLMDGTRIGNITRAELKSKLKKFIYKPDKDENHPDNSAKILDEQILMIDCPNCGMFYSFKEEEDIPKKDTYCVTCGRAIIIYTNRTDNFFHYDGKQMDMEKVINEIHKEADEE